MTIVLALKRFVLSWNGQEYIDYCTGIANPRHPKFFTGKRLLVREITNPSIYATITCDELYNDPAIIIVKDNNIYPIEVVLAILNSKLATFYHFNHSPKATKGAFPKILVQDIKEFPLPAVTESQKQTIIELVDKVLSAKKDNPQANTGAWETELDRLVYELYGLSEEEIKALGNRIGEDRRVRRIKFTSAEEAWEKYKKVCLVVEWTRIY